MRRQLPFLLAIFGACTDARFPLPAVVPELQVSLARHVLDAGRPPEEYVIGKFQTRDVVFLAEHGRVLHDVRLVREIIPRLPAAGVRRLGIEFVGARDQEALDRVVGGAQWDEAQARNLVWRRDAGWGYREYVDLILAAWTVNRDRGPGEPPFRVVALGGPPDAAADIVVRSGEKMLAYVGVANGLTAFRTESAGVGNLVHDRIGARCCTIFLHAPWPSALGPDAPAVYPADGHIDATMIGLSDRNRRAGFDVAGSAFAELSGTSSAWSTGRSDFTLGDFCDGYVFQTALHLYEGVTPIEDWYGNETENAALAESCDIPRQFRRYH